MLITLCRYPLRDTSKLWHMKGEVVRRRGERMMKVSSLVPPFPIVVETLKNSRVCDCIKNSGRPCKGHWDCNPLVRRELVAKWVVYMQDVQDIWLSGVRVIHER